jgi:hypothetical protein
MSDSLLYPSSGDETYFYTISVLMPTDQPGVFTEIIVKEDVTIPTQSSYSVDLYLRQ